MTVCLSVSQSVCLPVCLPICRSLSFTFPPLMIIFIFFFFLSLSPFCSEQPNFANHRRLPQAHLIRGCTVHSILVPFTFEHRVCQSAVSRKISQHCYHRGSHRQKKKDVCVSSSRAAVSSRKSTTSTKKKKRRAICRKTL